MSTVQRRKVDIFLSLTNALPGGYSVRREQFEAKQDGGTCMGYHSFRNIGYRLTDAEAACTKWRKKYAGFDPSRAAEVLQLPVDEACIYATYFGRRYRLHLADGILEKETDQPDVWTEDLFMNEALVLYHLLGDVQAQPRQTGVWCSEADLDPVRIRSGNRTDPLLNGFASDFAGRIPELEEAALRLGGTKIAKGDSSWEFQPIPQITLRLIFWDADDEFPAQTQVMVDSGVTDYMHYEAVGCMIADLFAHLGGGEKEAGRENSRKTEAEEVSEKVKFPVS